MATASSSEDDATAFMNEVLLGKTAAVAAPKNKHNDNHTAAAAAAAPHHSSYWLDESNTLPAVTKRGASNVALFARTVYAALRHGEKLGGEYTDTAAAARPVPIGATGQTLSEYRVRHGDDASPLAVGVAWYTREAHHDPLGLDPMMLSMFLLAFCARLVYPSLMDAFILTIFVAFAELAVWFVVRAASPTIAKALDVCESPWIGFVYNWFAFVAGLATGALVLATWPGLQSLWDALGDTHCGDSEGVFLVWAPCTDAGAFICQTLLFVLVFAAAFDPLYVPSMIALVLVVPLARISQTTYDAANNLMMQALSAAFFWAWFSAPIKGTYVWNMLVALSCYVFVYSIAALSATI